VGSLARLVVYALLPYLGAYAGARLALARGAREIRAGRVTAVLTCVVAVSSVVGLLAPAVLHTLERDTARIQAGEVWRLVTALFQQDGGLPGTIANIVALLVIGSVAEHLFGSLRTAGIFAGVGVLAQVPALAWQPTGAGNSVANFGLAGAVALYVLLDGARPRPAMAAALVTMLVGLGLTVLADVHGPAVLLGAAGAPFLRHGQQVRPTR
jgi:hypothetical protein